MTTTTQTGMSLDELMQRIERGERFELVDGQMVEEELMKYWHGEIAHTIRDLLSTYAQQHQAGKAYTEMLFILPEALATRWLKGARRPDVMFVPQAKLDAFKQQNPNWQELPLALVPDLVVEVASETDGLLDVIDKIDGYLADGVRLVWLVITNKRRVVVHQPDSNVQRAYNAEDTLDGGDVLPGFSVRVGDFFADS